MRLPVIMVVLVAAVSMVGSRAVHAQLSNPNLLDVNMGATDVANPNAFGFVQLEQTASFGQVYNYAVAQEIHGAGHYAELELFAYEPDKVLRKSNSGQIQQKGQLLVAALYADTGSSFSGTGVAPLCAGAWTAKDTDGNGSADSLKWKASCPDIHSTLAATGMTGPQQATFITLYGGALTDPVKFHGKNP